MGMEKIGLGASRSEIEKATIGHVRFGSKPDLSANPESGTLCGGKADMMAFENTPRYMTGI
ncbi:MAG: hypothetical protein IH994_03415 [Proteobacteria bacterium]|nr:hypothetical protein [Pseudomonadota bacterium]